MIVERMAFIPQGVFYSSNESWFKAEEIEGEKVVFGVWSADGTNTLKKGAKTILFFHGNGECIGSYAQFCNELANNLKCNVVSLEYPGYGLSGYRDKVRPSEERTKLHAMLLFNYLTTGPHYFLPVYLFGRSLGTGVAAWLASHPFGVHKRADGLIMMSAYTSIVSVVFPRLAKWFPRMDIFKTYELIKEVRCPVLFVHGTRDEVISYDHSKELYMMRGAAEDTIVLLKNANHNELSSAHQTKLQGEILKLMKN